MNYVNQWSVYPELMQGQLSGTYPAYPNLSEVIQATLSRPDPRYRLSTIPILDFVLKYIDSKSVPCHQILYRTPNITNRLALSTST
jgi:hypothetical protein